MKHFSLFLLLLLTFSFATTACDNNEEPPIDSTFDNWKERNDEAFAMELQRAKQSIAKAQSLYGKHWQQHCPYRLLTNYQVTTGRAATSTDTIIVRIDKQGTGAAVRPLYTDTVQINYQGHTIPVTSYPKGILFDYSGTRPDSLSIFHPQLSLPTKFSVAAVVPGFTTALLHMAHIGDVWRVYIPYQAGYYHQPTQSFPAYTNLIFDIQLKGVYRKGQRSS